MIAETASDAARQIARALRDHGHLAFFVGGCVRDLLLHRDPKDYDIATGATPDQVLRLFPHAHHVGAKFGVVLVPAETGFVEIATFRSDSAYHDGRHPSQVAFETDPRRDVLRRDFTINGLLMDPFSGDIVDYTGGRADLERGIVRAIGDPETRFAEDHLRMLRAIRFAARLGFTIDPATFAAIVKLHGEIARISAERVRDELTRILIEGGARRGFEMLDASGLLLALLPEISALKGVQQPPEFHPEGDVWTHTLMLLEDLRSPTVTLALGALLHDVGKPASFRFDGRRIRFNGHAELGARMAVDILARLRFPQDQIRQVEALVANHMRFRDVPEMRESTLKRFFRLDRFTEHLELHRLDCSNAKGDLRAHDLARARFESLPPEQLAPPRLLTGDDLLAAGFQPGAHFKALLDAAEDAQLEGRIHSRDQALALIRTLYRP